MQHGTIGKSGPLIAFYWEAIDRCNHVWARKPTAKNAKKLILPDLPAADRDDINSVVVEALLWEFEDAIQEQVGRGVVPWWQYQPWLEQALRYKAIDRVRKAVVDRKHDELFAVGHPEGTPSDESDVDEDDWKTEARKWLAQAIDKLPDELRDVILLHKQGYETPKIILMLGVPHATVYRRLKRAIELLCEMRKSGR